MRKTSAFSLRPITISERTKSVRRRMPADFARRSSWRIAILAGTTFTAVPLSTFGEQVLYAIDNIEPRLSVVDPHTGAEISFVTVVLAGETIASGNGLAVNPLTNEMYAAVKLSGQTGPGRNLIKIDPETGAATNVGSMGQPIASLAFTDAGVLFGVSGDCAQDCGGAATPETLFTVDTTDGSLTLFQTLGNGEDGEAIAFNPNDGMMYHMSGWGGNFVFEKVDLATGAVTAIPLSGDVADIAEATGFTFDAAQDLFVGCVIDWDAQEGTFGTASPDGVFTTISDLAIPWKDYAFYEAQPAASPKFPLVITTTLLLGEDENAQQ